MINYSDMRVSICHEEHSYPMIERFHMEAIPNVGDIIIITPNLSESEDKRGIYKVTQRHFFLTESAEGEGVMIYVTDC